ncbi:hypothetical protein NE237_024733 [Protea cynaroides]|uniref:RNase H type-1 domain-containing protein n=1 Tax=Protea cynaroides TaxID=273540 RepID=A0A9Q0H0K4_9MAGN|nr:hypothetical protein NE237_024733 [Protea cynaroides]
MFWEPPSISVPKWIPPQSGITKLNVGAYFSETTAFGGGGFIFRYCEGHSLFAATQRFFASLAFLGEALALRMTLQATVDLGFHPVHVESDCLALILCINDPNVNCPLDIQPVRNDIRHLASLYANSRSSAVVELGNSRSQECVTKALKGLVLLTEEVRSEINHTGKDLSSTEAMEDSVAVP